MLRIIKNLLHMKKKDNKKNNKKFLVLRICSLNAVLDHIMYEKEKIKFIIDLIEDKKICINIASLQNIEDNRAAGNLINVIKSKGWTVFPENEVNFSNLIITKYPILSGKTEMIDIITGTKDIKFINIINIDFNGVIVSIYNFTLQKDFTGISNKLIREIQIKKIALEMAKNIKFVEKEYNRKHIGILCANMNIYQYKDTVINDEYNESLKILDGVNLHMTKINTNNYILLCAHNMGININSKDIKKMIYKKYGIIVKNSYTKENINYIDFFEEHPVIATLMIEC